MITQCHGLYRLMAARMAAWRESAVFSYYLDFSTYRQPVSYYFPFCDPRGRCCDRTFPPLCSERRTWDKQKIAEERNCGDTKISAISGNRHDGRSAAPKSASYCLLIYGDTKGCHDGGRHPAFHRSYITHHIYCHIKWQSPYNPPFWNYSGIIGTGPQIGEQRIVGGHGYYNWYGGTPEIVTSNNTASAWNTLCCCDYGNTLTTYRTM